MPRRRRALLTVVLGAAAAVAIGIAWGPTSPRCTIAARTGGPFEGAELSGDGRILVIFARDHLERWSVDRGELIASVESSGVAVYRALSPDGDVSASAYGDHIQVRSFAHGLLWEWRTDEHGFIGPITLSPSGEVLALVVLPPRRTGLTSYPVIGFESALSPPPREDPRVELRRTLDGSVVASWPVPVAAPLKRSVPRLAFSPDGRTVAAEIGTYGAGPSRTEVVFAAPGDSAWSGPVEGALIGFASPSEVLVRQGERPHVFACALDRRGASRMLYMGVSAREWFFAARDRFVLLRERELEVRSSADGSRLGRVTVSGSLFDSLDGSADVVTGVRVSHDGRRVALVASKMIPSGRVEVWDIP